MACDADHQPAREAHCHRRSGAPALDRTSSVEPTISGLPQSSTSLMSGSIMRIPIFRSSTRRPEELNPNASLSLTSNEAMAKGRPETGYARVD